MPLTSATISATEVASRLGLKRCTHSWRGRCPCCEYAGDTFSVRTGRDGRARLFCANGCQYDALVWAAARATGQPTPAPATGRSDGEARKPKSERGLALWRGSEIAIGTLADTYLTARGLRGLAASAALRYRSDTPHPEYARLPAMIALVSDALGGPVAIHRTYLSRDGGKAPVEPVKASLGPVWGGAIRLDPLPSDKPVVIGEGIETSASAGRLMGLPAWAAISAGNLARGLVLPPDARNVVIAADPDEAGERAAREASLRWSAEGRNVRIAHATGSGDFNDLLREVAHA